jgi:predicted RND superfamily exporter protein
MVYVKQGNETKKHQEKNSKRCDTLLTMMNCRLYSVCVDELIMTAGLGVVAIGIVCLLFIPHWSAVCIVVPLISVLVIELLGVLQWAGQHIDVVTYVAIFMALGLLVDYIIHVLFRFYECEGNRREKTLEMLRTMGTSILLGGLSTLLGTLPLAFCSSAILRSAFIAALGMITLGLGHGLILLPVLLSMFGTEEQVIMHTLKQNEDGMDRKARVPVVVNSKVGPLKNSWILEEELTVEQAIKTLADTEVSVWCVQKLFVHFDQQLFLVTGKATT